MLALTPPGAELELHVNLLRHGRRTCHARRPALRELRAAADVPARRGRRVRVGLATCAEMPAGDEDEQELVAALRAAGHEPVWATWDDAGRRLGRLRRRRSCAARGTTTSRRDDYVAWAERVPRLHNPAAVLRVEHRQALPRPSCARPACRSCRRSSARPARRLPLLEAEVVVKPTVSAGSRDTARFKADDERAAEMLLKSDPPGRAAPAMVQPYVPSVDERGETALLYFGGEFSHAIQKAPLLRRGAGADRRVLRARRRSPRARRPTASAPSPTASSRGPPSASAARWPTPASTSSRARGGGPLLLELELTEPSLFFLHAPGAAGRFVEKLTKLTASRA